MNVHALIGDTKTELRLHAVTGLHNSAASLKLGIGATLHYLSEPTASGLQFSVTGEEPDKLTPAEYYAGLESYLAAHGVTTGGDDNPNGITVLTAPPGQHQSKDWSHLDENGKPKPAASNVVKWLVHGVPLPDDLDALAATVADLAAYSLNVLVYGCLRDDVTPRTGWHDRIVDSNSERVKAGTAVVTFQDAPRALLIADIDTPVTDPLEMQQHLPEWARSTNHVLVLSGSCGLPGGKPGIRGRAIIRLDRAVSATNLRALCAGSGVDIKPLTPVGLHYIAAPLTGGIKDPHVGNRVIVVRQPGWRDVAAVPAPSAGEPGEAVPPATLPVVPGTAQNGPGLVMTPAGTVPADAVCESNGEVYFTDAFATELVKSMPVQMQQQALAWFHKHVADRLTDEAAAGVEEGAAGTGADYIRDTMLPGGPLARAGLLDVASFADGAEMFAQRRGWGSGSSGQAQRSAVRALTVIGIATNNTVMRELLKLRGARAAQAQRSAGAVGEAGFNPGSDDGEQWPALSPLNVAAAAVPLPKIQWVPPIYRPWLADVQRWMSCPLDFLIVALYAMLGSVIGARLAIRPRGHDDGWSEVANLWGLIIAKAGALKTPAMKEILKPLERMSVKAHAAFTEETKVYKAREEAHKGIVSGLKRATANQLANGNIEPKHTAEGVSGNAVDMVDTDALEKAILSAPETPVLRRHIVRAVGSGVRFIKILSENPQGVLSVQDEMVSTLHALSTANDPAQRSVWLQSWNGSGPVEYESETQGVLRAENGCMTVLGGAQPKALLAYLGKADAAGDAHDGLIQRFGMMAWPVPVKWIRPTGRRSVETREAAYAAVEALAAADLTAVGAKVEEGEIPWLPYTDEGRKLFEAWENAHHHRANEADSLDSHFSKYPTLVNGLALIYSVSSFLPKRTAPWQLMSGVDAEAARVAVEMSAYFEAHARKFYAAGSSRVGAAVRLAEAILEGKPVGGMTIAAIIRMGWSGLTEDDDVERAANTLADLGWLRFKSTRRAGKGGHTALKIELRPNITAEGKVIYPTAAGAGTADE